MAKRGQTVVIKYYVYTIATGVGLDEDVANHTLRLNADGTAITPAGAKTVVDATNAPGWYKLTITPDENIGKKMILVGKSSTAGTVLVATQWDNTDATPDDFRKARPWFFDQMWRSAGGGSFRTSGADIITATPTITEPAAVGDATITVSANTDLAVGELIAINSGEGNPYLSQVYRITSITDTLIGIAPNIRVAVADNATFNHYWDSQAHPTRFGVQDIAAKLATSKQFECVCGKNLVPDTPSRFNSSWTAGTGTPTGWTRTVVTSLSLTAAAYADAFQLQPARRGNSCVIAAGGAGDGISLSASIPVIEGESYVAQYWGYTTDNDLPLTVIDADTGTTIIRSDTWSFNAWVTGTAYKVGKRVVSGGVIYACVTAHTADASFAVDLAAAKWVVYAPAALVKNFPELRAVPFIVPVGTKNIKLQFIATQAATVNIDDVRLLRLPCGVSSTARLIEQPDAATFERSILFMGDSWSAPAATSGTLFKNSGGTNLYLYALNLVHGTTSTLVMKGVSGDNLSQINARLLSNVLPYMPQCCVIQYGANDVLIGNFTQQEHEENIDTALRLCLMNGITPIVLGIPACETKWESSTNVNDWVRARCDHWASVIDTDYAADSRLVNLDSKVSIASLGQSRDFHRDSNGTITY